MKVLKTTATKTETTATLDIFEGKDLPLKIKKKVAKDVGQYLIEQTLMDVNSSKSPVDGYGSFDPLTSKEYKLKKKGEVGNTRADLQLSGETLDALDFKVTEDGLTIGVFGDRAPIADGHNNLSGKSELPVRRFIPGEGESYRPAIQQEFDRIISDALAENGGVSPQDLSEITTKSSLYDILGDRLGLTSRSEIRLAVYRNEDLLELLRDEDLIDLL